jgi:hypothetical protein
MESLPTEMKEHIFRWLPQAALSSMSRVSKAVHGSAQKYLYRDIVLSADQPLNIFQLFFTILKHKNLAAHTQSFTLTEDVNSKTQKFDESFSGKLLDVKTEVKDLIKNVIAPENDPRFMQQWLGSIYDGSRSFVSRSAKCESQAALAVILCMATNLGYLQFSGTKNVIVDMVLTRRWKDPKGDVDGAYPFHKLKTLHLYVADQHNIIILPSLERIFFANLMTRVSLSCPYLQDDMGSSLRRLDVSLVDMDPCLLESVISLFGCPALEELFTSRVCWCDYDFARISGILVSYAPTLKNLE